MDCTHPETELRRRTIANGGVQIAPQCLACGRAMSNPQKRPDDWRSLPPWDDALADQYWNAYRVAREHDMESRRIRTVDTETQWRRSYDAFIASREWREIRALVFRRSGSLCEACRQRRAEQVHHVSYPPSHDDGSAPTADEWREWPLWELRAICVTCHERWHRKRRAAS